jgi:hypothetical protein
MISRSATLFSTRGGAINWEPLEEEESEYDDEADDSSEGDSEDADDEDIFSSPFLDSFQEEVHEIVQDYRSQVRETFSGLKEEILRERERQFELAEASKVVRPSKVRPSKPAPPVSLDSSENEEEEEGTVAYAPSASHKRREKAPMLTPDAEDELMVGDTDEEDAYVLERLFGRDDSEDSDAPAVEAEEPIELSRKQMEGSSKKKKKKKPTKKKRKGKKASERETVSDVQPLREPVVINETRAGSAAMATANSPSAALANAQLYKSLIVSVSFLAIAILVNMAARILIKMLGKGS